MGTKAALNQIFFSLFTLAIATISYGVCVQVYLALSAHASRCFYERVVT